MPDITLMAEDTYQAFLNSPSRRGHPRKSIGGSDAAYILGLSRYGDAAKAYDSILEQAAPSPRRPVFDRGHAMEPIIASLWAAKTNRVLFSPGGAALTLPGGIRFDIMGAAYPQPGRPWLRCSPDRVWIIGDSSGSPNSAGILEIKCLGERTFATTLSDGVDPGYYAQLQLYLGALGCDHGAFAIFNADQWKLHEFDVPFDPTFYTWMLERLDNFWENNIDRRVRPTPTQVAENRATVMRVPPAARGAEVEVVEGPAWQTAIDRLVSASAEKKLAEEAFERARESVKDLMESTGIPGARYGRTTVKWINVTRKALDTDRLYAAGLVDPAAVLHGLEDVDFDHVRQEDIDAVLAAARVDLDTFKTESTSTQFRITQGRS